MAPVIETPITEVTMTEELDIQELHSSSDGDLALFLENMAGCMDEHPAYKGQNVPDCVPQGHHMRAHSAEVKQIATAVKQDPSREPERIPIRERAYRSVKFAWQYVVMYATHVNEPKLLDTLGVKRVRRAPRNMTVKKPVSLHKFTVAHGKDSGTVKVHVNSWEGKGSVELQICYSDPAQEASWQALRMSHYCHFIVDGLEPARRAYFRARFVNDAGVSAWSEVVELIII